MMKTGTKVIHRAFALLAALCMACMLSLPVFATDANSAVNNAKSGVVQILLTYTDDNQVEHSLIGGTGFLINNSTVITCDHVVSMSDTYLNCFAEQAGKSINDFKSRLGIRISVLRDVTIKATIKNQSAEMDYAILNLESQIYDRSYLPIRSSAEVEATETVYALGFPSTIAATQDVNIYTSDDVNITSGKVGKNARFTFTTSERNPYDGITWIDGKTYENVDCISHGALLEEGNSGGPLLDSNGYVIGINAVGNNAGTINYSVAIDQLTKALDALGIEYTKAGTATPASTDNPEPVPTEEPVVVPVDKTQLSSAVTDAQNQELKEYDEDSVATFTTALEAAQNVLANENATQQDVDSAITALANAKLGLTPKEGFPIWIIIAVAAVVAIIIIVLIVVLVRKGRDKDKNNIPPYNGNGGSAFDGGSSSYGSMSSGASGGFSAPPTTPQQNYTAPVSGSSNVTTVLSAGSSETTVLSAGSGETTVLNQNTNYGTLVRTKTGEKVAINSASFIIGKEMAKVNYCVSDNTSVSRTHVRITNRAGVAYVVDLKTTNGTFVNGVKLTPNQETPLHNGDKLSLADEEFTFNA